MRILEAYAFFAYKLALCLKVVHFQHAHFSNLTSAYKIWCEIGTVWLLYV